MSTQGRTKYSVLWKRQKICDRDPYEMGMAMPSNQNQYDKSEVCSLALNWNEISRTWVWSIPHFIILYLAEPS